MKKKEYDNKSIVTVALFAAVTFVLAISPLGFIPIGFINATTMHIPVIIAAIYISPKMGALVGGIFGLISLVRSIFFPSIMTPFIINPMVSVFPRIFIGLVAGYVYLFLSKKTDRQIRGLSIIFWLICSLGLIYLAYTSRQDPISFGFFLAAFGLIFCIFMVYKSFKRETGDFPTAFSAFVGSITNTLGFLTALYLLYGKDYALALGADPKLAGTLIFGLGVSSGIPEAIVSVIISTAIVKALRRIK
ncbi:MAG: ECF transporter S component [Finegoldia sp.]|nr:ECF transporter S component [Finegoldia sp.]